MEIVSIALVIIGLCWLIYEIYKIRVFQIIDGKVVDNVKKVESRKGGYTYSPVIVYKDKEKNRKEYTAKFSTKPRLFYASDNVKLLYDAKEDKIMGVLHFIASFFIPWIFIFIGLTIMFFSTNYNIQIQIFEWIKNWRY